MGTTESLVEERTITKESGRTRKLSFSKLLATGLGVGYLPFAPGTWGSLQGVVLMFLFYRLPLAHLWLWHLALTVLCIGLATWVCRLATVRMQQADPPQVVIDEIAGQFLTLLIVGMSPVAVGLGFGFFRLFDIWKPFPIRRVESVPGGVGVVLDDLIAGCYAGITAWLLLLAVGNVG